MLSKAKIKFINSLKMGKYRKQHKMFFAEGSINVLDFIKSGFLPNELFATEAWIGANSELLDFENVQRVSEKELSRITALKNPSEVLAVFDLPKCKIPEPSTINNLVLVLDDIKDPGNLGTIIRTADWFGVKNIICSTQTVDAFNPKVVQATMGSLSRLSISYLDLSEWLSSINNDTNIYGAVLNGENIGKINKQKNDILIIGSEAHGISKEVLKFVNKPVTIPRSEEGGAESLNASIATAILLYAFLES